MPKVSIIIPVYNVEKYLTECIESVLEQTLSDWELILVNDGSPDGSEEICLNYARSDQRIKYISQKNQGVSVARNNGLKAASGKYIFFMDSDDTIDCNFLKSSYLVAEKEQADIVVIGAYFLKKPLSEIPALPAWAVLINLNFLRKYDVYFPVAIQPCEDGLFTHRLLALTNRLAANPNGIYNYRSHEEQNHIRINQACAKVLKQISQWFKILDDFYKKYNLYQTKSLHLARFIEHEPFGMRLISMPFTFNQKKELIKIIQTFMIQNVLPHLSSSEYKKLDYKLKYITKPYNLNFLTLILLVQKILEKLTIFILRRTINLIPIRKIRKALREKYLR